MPGPAVPHAYCAGMENAAVLNQWVMVRWSEGRLGVPFRFGRSVGETLTLAPVSTFETEVASDGPKCMPVYIVQMPETSQSPMRYDAIPLFTYWRPEIGRASCRERG